jgi:hypothetical protein
LNWKIEKNKLSNRNCCKRSHCVKKKDSEFRKPAKEGSLLLLYSLPNFHKLLFLLPKCNLKNKIILWHWGDESEKATTLTGGSTRVFSRE